MGKPVVNQEFRAIGTAHYAKAGLLPRAKGGRYGPLLENELPFELAYEGGLPAGWQLQLLGTGPGYDCGGGVIQYDHLAVTSPTGWVYPAYRRASPGNTYAICHCLQYVGRQG